MSTTAFSSAMAISVFAADERESSFSPSSSACTLTTSRPPACPPVYYDLAPNYGLCIFTLIGSQFFGYGLAGLSRSICVFPTYAVFPAVIPTVQMFDVLHRDRDLNAQKKRLRYFVIVAVGIFVWSWFPEYVLYLLFHSEAPAPPAFPLQLDDLPFPSSPVEHRS